MNEKKLRLPLPLEEAVSDLLKVKPPARERPKRRKAATKKKTSKRR